MKAHHPAWALCSAALLAFVGIVTLPNPVHAQDSVLDQVSSAPVPQENRPGARPGRLVDIVFKTPSGWKVAEPNTNARLFIAPDSSPGKESAILLVRGSEFEGEFRSAFDKAVSAGLQDRANIKKVDLPPSQSSEGYEVLTQVIASVDKQGQQQAALYAGINMNGRLVLVGYLASSQELFQKYGSVLTRFLGDLDLPKAKNNSTAKGGAIPVHGRAPEEVARDEDKRRRPGKVTGNVYDAQGRPFRVPGCKVSIHVWGVTAAGERTFFDGDADAQGHYEIPVVHGLYAVNCTARMPLGGQVLSVDLEVLDGKRPSNKEDSTPGICKDFGLKLTGPIFDGRPGAYHGGSITLTDGGAYHSLFDALSRRYPEGTVVKLVLTPTSRLIDGSEASPLTLTYHIKSMETGETLASIPLALYTATARLVTPNGQQKALKIGLFPGNSYGSWTEVVFTPEAFLDGRAGIPNLVVHE